MSKNLCVSPDYVLYGLTFENLILYSHAMPVYTGEESHEEALWDDRLDANTPGRITLPDGIVTNPF